MASKPDEIENLIKTSLTATRNSHEMVAFSSVLFIGFNFRISDAYLGLEVNL